MNGKRKVQEGTVLSHKMQHTIVVSVERSIPHPQYRKIVKSKKKYYADYRGDTPLVPGQKVTIEQSRPISKLKRWVVKEVLS